MNIKINKSVEKFIRSLEDNSIAKVLRTIDLLEEFTFKLAHPHSKKVEGDIFELRVRGQQEIRIFYVFNKDEIILFHGFIKKSQRIPKEEIKKARNKLKDVL